MLDGKKVLMNDVIDFRFRPVGARSWNRETTFHYLDRMGLQPTPSFEDQSLDLMFQEMDDVDSINYNQSIGGWKDGRRQLRIPQMQRKYLIHF